MALITAWRVVRDRYADTAFDGEGARRSGGRFNSPGTRMVYSADSLPLAMLEVMVHVPSYRQFHGRVAIPVRFDDRLVEALGEADLPTDWTAMPPARSTQALGDAWVQEQRSVVLRLPSLVTAHAHNYLLNPDHPDMTNVTVGTPEALRVDPRLIK